ncbi:uncharacterized protein LOC110443942 [Mizuhopecten yessoensis]|uniref:uncharacterized protein LOC110443942 n=1 Tax=Mizuhopecten yessoensis TaxID=6573 RepID=UPI000B45E17F|nr:uncharacterized protein LOC110443942 [Mizuhopecten yessoensis]
MNKHVRGKENNTIYVGDDDPWLSIPRTSKWRLKRNKTNGNSNDEQTITSQCADQDGDHDDTRTTEKTHATPIHSSALPDLDPESQSDPELDFEVEDHIISVVDQGEDVDITHEDERQYGESTDVPQEEILYDASEEENIPLDEDLEPEVEHDDNMPIYEGATITTGQSALLILSLAFRHSLTGECISDILTCVSLHCLRKNSIHSSLYKFRKYFSELKTNLKLHSYCQKCDYLLTQDNRICPVCSSETDDSSTYFVEIPVEEQISELFRRKTFHDLILHRFERKKKRASCVEDIYDGELYRKYSRKEAFLDSKYNISLMWYTDGVPLFKSSKVSLWPLYFSINELPYKERVKPENLLFAGMWYGKLKPTMSTFLKPFHETMDKLNKHGVYVECNHCNEKFTSKALILCGTCDLPAKCMMLNMTQFNGKFGCPRCMQPGKVVPTGKGHTRVFPFDEENVDGPCRTRENFIQHGEQAFETNSITYGVKGPSWLTAISADAIQGTSIDYMHTVLLGLIRRLLTLWFDSKFSSRAFSVSKLVHKTDRRLATIKPPHFVTRLPKSILEHSQYWKASECRSWLFYYSVPVLFGILDPVYFHHYLLFYEAMYLLNLDSISQGDLQHCDELIITFCCQFSALYGKEHMSANLHQLLHISDAVTSLMRMLSESMENDLESPAGQLYQKLTSKKRQHGKVSEVIAEGVFVIGSLHRQNIMGIYATAIMEFFGKAVSDTFVFYRLLLNGCMYFSSHYSHKTKFFYC